MARPVVPILYNTATVDARYAPSLAAAFTELFLATGVQPRVLSAAEVGDGIPGGSRTLEQAIRAGTGTSSNHYEGNQFAAVDVDNQRYFRNVLGSARFEQIMASHGWENVTIDGTPFGIEPWHFANQHTVSAAGDTGTPLGDEFDMASIQDLNQSVDLGTDRVRREVRARLYECTEHVGEYITVRWDLPSNDPGKVGYPLSKGQLDSLEQNYQYLADDEAQAKQLLHAQLVTVINIAHAKDNLFTPSKNFVAK